METSTGYLRLANHFVILQKLGDHGEPAEPETVEAMLEHSKTRFRRWTNALGVSKGRAQYVPNSGSRNICEGIGCSQACAYAR